MFDNLKDDLKDDLKKQISGIEKNILIEGSLISVCEIVKEIVDDENSDKGIKNSLIFVGISQMINKLSEEYKESYKDSDFFEEYKQYLKLIKMGEELHQTRMILSVHKNKDKTNKEIQDLKDNIKNSIN